MPESLSANSNLKTRLEPFSRLDYTRSKEDLWRVQEYYDFEFRESITNKLIAAPRRGGHDIIAKMSITAPRHVYAIQAQNRQVDVIFREASPGRLNISDHHIFDLFEGNREVGHIEHFPNNGFVLTRKEKCFGLTTLCFGGRTWTHFSAEHDVSWWQGMKYSVLYDDRLKKIALVADSPKFFNRKRYAKFDSSQDELMVGFFMALSHGLVFGTRS